MPHVRAAVVVVEMSEWLAPITEGSEAIVATRQRLMFDAQFRESRNQFVAQRSHLRDPQRDCAAFARSGSADMAHQQIVHVRALIALLQCCKSSTIGFGGHRFPLASLVI
jgi:hypothetical protein